MKKLFLTFCLLVSLRLFAAPPVEDTGATNYVTASTAAVTNIVRYMLISTNISYPLLTFTGPTNTLDLSKSFHYYVASTNVEVTGFVGLTNDLAMWSTLHISNSSAGTITAYFTAAELRKGDTTTTNALRIASGKIGFVSFVGNGIDFVRYTTACEP